MNTHEIEQSPVVRIIIFVLAGLIVIIAVFKMGMDAGYHRALYAAHMADNFQRTFVDPHAHSLFDQHLPPSGHGAFGEIVSVTIPTFVVADRTRIEQTIHVSSSTIIRKFTSDVPVDSLQPGENVVVLGSPNDQGQIDAQLIRIIPPVTTTAPPQASSSSKNYPTTTNPQSINI